MIAKGIDQDQPKPSKEPKSDKTSGPSLFDIINKKEPEEGDKDDKDDDKEDKKKLPKKPEDKKPNAVEDRPPPDKTSRSPNIADMLNRI